MTGVPYQEGDGTLLGQSIRGNAPPLEFFDRKFNLRDSVNTNKGHTGFSSCKCNHVCFIDLIRN
jgi:hypothetical protein